jgi:hypothetical protein
MDSTSKIRALNDALRTIAAGNGRVYVTAGIAALPMQDQVHIMWRVRDFSAFTPENDPSGHHDFGRKGGVITARPRLLPSCGSAAFPLIA